MADVDRRVVAASILIGGLLTVVVIALAYDPPDADIKYDWLVATESLKPGGDAYRDLLDIAHDEGVDIVVHAGPGVDKLTGHPRSPGAILLQIPLVALSYDLLFAFSVFVSMAALGVVLSKSLYVRNTRALVLVLGAVLIGAPLFVTLRYAGQAAVVAALALSGWILNQRRDSVLGGILLGLAAVLKVYPAILIVPLLIRRRFRAAGTTLVTVVIVNLAGILLPGVSLRRAIEELSAATNTWVGLSSNGSVVGLLVDVGLQPLVAQTVAIAVALVVVMSVVFSGRTRSLEHPFVWLGLGLLMLPLSWTSYDIVLVPAIAGFTFSANREIRLTGLLAFSIWIIPVLVFPIAVISSGAISVVVRLLLLFTTWRSMSILSEWGLKLDQNSFGPRQIEPIEVE